MPAADPKKPADKPAPRLFYWHVDNALAGPIGGAVQAATSAEAERAVRDWLAQGLTVTPADKG